MTIYVAMLRGINVGAHKRIRMDQLRLSFKSLGFEQVKTYIQSGNVIFKTKKMSSAILSRQIEERIAGDFGFPASVVCRTIDEIAGTIKNNPFLNQPGIDPAKFHVTFLSEAPAKTALKKLEALTLDPDQCRCLDKEIYLYLPNGISGSSLMKSPLDRTLSVVTTTRNWRTVTALHQLCQGCR